MADNPYVGQDLTQKFPAAALVREQVVYADEPVKFRFAAKDSPSVITDYLVKNRYYKDGHRVLIPIGSPEPFAGASAAFVQLAAPTLIWVCDWTIQRDGKQPEPPSPYTVGSNWVLLYDHWEPTSLDLNAAGNIPGYRISGTYIYAHKNPNAATNKDIHYPLPPWMEDAFPRAVEDTSLLANVSEPLNLANVSKLGPVPNF